ncbi:MAG: hypothetical protein JWR80_8615 [Bradyrhizobium sp.]|nr:hypothetical protein [Bradyrhizobium sp.]
MTTMSEATDPTKHHYIPVFLLRWWAGNDGRFERYDRPIPTKIMVRRVFPSEAGWMKNLYASPGHSLGPQWLEKHVFQIIDSRAAPVLRKLNSDSRPELSDEERSAWTVFLRSLFHRTPDYLRSTLSTGMEAFEETVEELREAYGSVRGESDPVSFDDYKARLTSDDARRAALRMLPDLILNPRIGQFLNNLPTRVITLPPGTRDFLMSDDPLARTNGLMKEGGHIAIPISPRRLFVSAWSEAMLAQISNMTPDELVGNVNRWVVESARYFIAAPDRSQERFVRNRFGADLKAPLLLPDNPGSTIS